MIATGDRSRADARRLARRVWAQLEPAVSRGLIVGSLRRHRATVHDIEFLVEPPGDGADLFGVPIWNVARVTRAALLLGRAEKAGDRYVKVRLPEGPCCDIFVCFPPATWGALCAIRTGPALLGRIAVTRLRARGLRCEDGRVVDRATGAVRLTQTEEQFFALAGVPCVPPAERDALAVDLARNQNEEEP